MTTDHEVEELLGAYALDAVDDDERAAVEAHLAICPRCRAEVDAHREVAAHLAQSGAPAPDHLWERIAGALSAEAPPMRLVVDDRGPRRRWWLGGGLLAAAAAVVVAVVVGVGVGGGGDADADLNDLAVAAFAAPEARTADLLDPNGRSLARVAVLPDGTGYLLAQGLPDLDERIYQLWGAAGETVVSLGPMGGAPEIVAFHTDPSVELLMVTEEERPVERSTNDPVVVGSLA